MDVSCARPGSPASFPASRRSGRTPDLPRQAVPPALLRLLAPRGFLIRKRRQDVREIGLVQKTMQQPFARKRLIIVECPRGLEERADVVLDRADVGDLLAQAQKRVDADTCGADRTVHGEDDVVRGLDELPHQRQVRAPSRHDMRPVSGSARHEHGGDVGHQGQTCLGIGDDGIDLVLDPQVIAELGDDLPARAGRHRLLHIVAVLVHQQGIDPQDQDIARLIREMRLPVAGEAHHPVGIGEGDDAASHRPA